MSQSPPYKPYYEPPQRASLPSIQTLLKVGLPTVLVLYLLGIVPGVKSPIDRIEAAIAAHDASARGVNEGILRALRTICRTQVPREVQYQCD